MATMLSILFMARVKDRRLCSTTLVTSYFSFSVFSSAKLSAGSGTDFFFLIFLINIRPLPCKGKMYICRQFV